MSLTWGYRPSTRTCGSRDGGRTPRSCHGSASSRGPARSSSPGTAAGPRPGLTRRQLTNCTSRATPLRCAPTNGSLRPRRWKTEDTGPASRPHPRAASPRKSSLPRSAPPSGRDPSWRPGSAQAPPCRPSPARGPAPHSQLSRSSAHRLQPQALTKGFKARLRLPSNVERGARVRPLSVGTSAHQLRFRGGRSL